MTDIVTSFATDVIPSVDPTNAAISTLQTTAQGLGGGAGGALLSIPGVGQPFVTGLNSLKQQSQNVLLNAQSMTPDQIMAKNDKINSDYQKLLDEAKAAGKPLPPPPQTTVQKIESSISLFFSSMFSTTLNICIFTLVLGIALLGSSMAANSIGLDKPTAYYIYYMFYGFILFWFAIPLSLYKYYRLGRKPMFHAIWAPIRKGKYESPMMNLLMYFFIYNPLESGIPAHYQSSITAVTTPIEV